MHICTYIYFYICIFSYIFLFLLYIIYNTYSCFWIKVQIFQKMNFLNIFSKSWKKCLLLYSNFTFLKKCSKMLKSENFEIFEKIFQKIHFLTFLNIFSKTYRNYKLYRKNIKKIYLYILIYTYIYIFFFFLYIRRSVYAYMYSHIYIFINKYKCMKF